MIPITASSCKTDSVVFIKGNRCSVTIPKGLLDAIHVQLLLRM